MSNHKHILREAVRLACNPILLFNLKEGGPSEHNQTLPSHFGEGGPLAVEEDIKKITSALLIQSAALNLCKITSLGASRHSPRKGKRVTAAFCNLHLPRKKRLNSAVSHFTHYLYRESIMWRQRFEFTSPGKKKLNSATRHSAPLSTKGKTCYGSV